MESGSKRRVQYFWYTLITFREYMARSTSYQEAFNLRACVCLPVTLCLKLTSLSASQARKYANRANNGYTQPGSCRSDTLLFRDVLRRELVLAGLVLIISSYDLYQNCSVVSSVGASIDGQHQPHRRCQESKMNTQHYLDTRACVNHDSPWPP